jgi:hypothetical protein
MDLHRVHPSHVVVEAEFVARTFAERVASPC